MATVVYEVGGNGGHPFSFDGTDNGATIKKLGVWLGEWQIKSVKVWLTDEGVQQFGNPDGGQYPYNEFEFQPGEQITSLSLWDNGKKDKFRLGAIKFSTNRGRSFDVKQTKARLTVEYKMDVGSGICFGVKGRCGADVDKLGFVFLTNVKSVVLKDVVYPTLSEYVPQVNLEEVFERSFDNGSSVEQQQTVEFSRTQTTTTSWSVTNSLEKTFSISVSASVLDVVDTESSYSVTVGTQSTHGLEESKSITETHSLPLNVPPKTRVTATGTIGTVVLDLPYKGTIEVTCTNGNVLKFPSEGVYKGVTYTAAKTSVSESSLE